MMDMLEFVVPALNIKVLLPLIIIIVTALTVLLVGVFSSAEKKSSLGYMSLIGVGLALLCIFKYSDRNISAYNGMFISDGFSLFISAIVCIVTFLTILISINYQKIFTVINCGEYYCLLLFAALGMILMGSSGNLIMVFLALETMSISIYALAGFRKDRERSIESAMKYFLLGAFASGFLLYGFALIYGATGTMDIIKIGEFFKTNPGALHTPLTMCALAMITVGFGFKIAMVPFHMWTPDVYEGAPSPVTGFMATGVKAAAFAALLRVFFTALSPLQPDWTTLMWIMAVLTMTTGNVLALAQKDLKRMLAYSSIAHAGYLLVGFVAGDSIAIAGMLFYLLGYAFMNLGAFGVLSLLGKKGEECTDLSDYAGMGFKYPLIGLVMAVFMFSMAGIPPTVGFMGKFYIFTAAIKSGFIWLAVIGVINSVISLYFYLRVIVYMYFKESDEAVPLSSPSPTIIAAIFLAAAGVMVMGMFPSGFWDMAVNAGLM
jgi:NADH-quinone oxidoreductase subunit N